MGKMRKIVTPAEMKRVNELKRPRKGESIYAEECGEENRKAEMDREFSKGSEGWMTAERRRRERRVSQEQVTSGVCPG
jgi:hypothetical protein